MCSAPANLQMHSCSNKCELDLSLDNVLWRVEPAFLQEITDNPDQAFGGAPTRQSLSECEGLKAGHLVLPAVFPLHRLDSQVFLSDFGTLVRPDKPVVEEKLHIQCNPSYMAPECHHWHGHNLSPASDMWSFMVVFVYLYLQEHAFPKQYSNLPERDPIRQIRDHLGPMPAEWNKSEHAMDNEKLYSSPTTEVDSAAPPTSGFARRLSENWQQMVAGRVHYYSECAARSDAGPRDTEAVKRLEKEYEVKKVAEPHALEVTHSIFRYMPERRLTAEQLLVNPHWVKLMQICGVQDGSEGVQ